MTRIFIQIPDQNKVQDWENVKHVEVEIDNTPGAMRNFAEGVSFANKCKVRVTVPDHGIEDPLRLNGKYYCHSSV